ncbi:zinc finger CCCH domain-containing protein 13 isoform X2 [Orussus abietinus]|uniref:zinc finger CCCH domain-containing protein 13 isoform X2 n=1 Tax=Orussus abietinus TaxID=222816 RepID=UPI0006255CEA|nr:zinc finger CCCH domain-containing protein 13 isoform X2 [Orussus abietinus]
MSKSNIRKITVDPTKCNTDSRRPSVFERLGTKPASTITSQNTSDYCRNWALNGSCSYGKNCKYANTHTLISPSKRVKKDNAPTNATVNEDPFKRLTSKIVKKTSHSPDLNLEEWNQTDLEYEDEKVLERRRQLLQRELELQMKKDKEVHGKEKLKHKKKVMSSSSSSRSSSTSSTSSSSTSDDSSSSTTSDSRKKIKKVKPKQHQSASSDYDDDKEKKKKLKLKRLGTKNEKPVPKKKRKLETTGKKETPPIKPNKKVNALTSSKKYSSIRSKSPIQPVSHVSSKSRNSKERNRSDSPKAKIREVKDIRETRETREMRETRETREARELREARETREPRDAREARETREAREMRENREMRELDKEKHHKKTRDIEEITPKEIMKTKPPEKVKEVDKGKIRATEDKNSKNEDRSKQRSLKEKEKRSGTPPLDRSKHQHLKESTVIKSKRSRTPEKSSRSKRDLTPPRHQDKSSSSNRIRDTDKKDRDAHKRDRSKEREEGRKTDQNKSRTSNQDDGHRKNITKDADDKNYGTERGNDRSRQRSRERRDNKEHNTRENRSHSRVERDQRESQRDKDRDDTQDRCRERQRERDRDKDPIKIRERDIPPLMATAAANPLEKNSRYRDKDRLKDGSEKEREARDRRSERDRDRGETKPLERDRSSQRFDARYERNLDKDSSHKSMDRDRGERFPRERSLDRIVDKNVPASRDHLLDRETIFERDRHRYGTRFERGHAADHERKEPHVPTIKVDRLSDRRDSPRRNVEVDRNFDRGFHPRHTPEHWVDQKDQPSHLEYRDHHGHEDDRRKPVESRRYNSPFEERRGRDDRTQSRYGVPADRPFDDLHHPLYGADKLRTGTLRDEGNPDSWDIHHELEHAGRDRGFPPSDWEEREWRARHALWDRESLPRSDAHDDEWAARYDSPMSEWKLNEPRKWDNQPIHLRGPFRNDRLKDLDLDSNKGKRRPFNLSETRDECPPQPVVKTAAMLMKDEPINKKLMELAEGRPRRSREKSADSFQKRAAQRAKESLDVREPLSCKAPAPSKPPPPVKLPAPEPKRPALDESLPTLHTESDLSDISDDPDDILNMEEEDIVQNGSQSPKKPVDVSEKESQPQITHEVPQPSPVEPVEETVFNKDKENGEGVAFSNRSVEDENMETMDFEEISDGELEEDIKTSGKGLGDALGVDWESLVKESQPRRSAVYNQDTAQGRWQCKAIFQRIGISAKYAGPELVEKLVKKYADGDPNKLLLDNIAFMHTALFRNRLIHDSGHNFLLSEDSLYRTSNEEDDDNDEILQPCTSLYEEVKTLLQQTA